MSKEPFDVEELVKERVKQRRKRMPLPKRLATKEAIEKLNYIMVLYRKEGKVVKVVENTKKNTKRKWRIASLKATQSYGRDPEMQIHLRIPKEETRLGLDLDIDAYIDLKPFVDDVEKVFKELHKLRLAAHW